ncbi:hypothetical protein M406DRAFT_98787 [Cryphonectria parasitica EP155]|uniref:NAD(P)-binding protein n=1 Tax=Cryphonectria parasitica (strain ATCC 38755 / EP155) TaxID=660469 RepID=A0A9P4Y9M3_CRYP1|nr:uncharacterized protein M406DRAFT_98787 [Cryphonectria parasitica EP155]KAF3768867.1 hypothetical protein M406DRAFT_98787 [Cryphonectria parasitica EP155]
MASAKTVVLITGGEYSNSGIGLELASQLLAVPSKHVLLGSRSVEKGEAAVKNLQSRDLSGTVELLHLDIADAHSIEAAAQTVTDKHGRLDVLVNNAAVGWPEGSTAEQFSQAFQTNATGPFLLVEACIALLKASTHTPRIINVSSGGGSIRKRLDPTTSTNKLGMWGIPYCASKASLNLITAAQSAVYGAEGVKVFAYTPGFTVSGLGPHNNAESGARPTSEGAAPIVRILNGERDDEHGGFLSSDGQYPW